MKEILIAQNDDFRPIFECLKVKAEQYDADTLYPFKSREFGGEIRLVTVNYFFVLTPSSRLLFSFLRTG